MNTGPKPGSAPRDERSFSEKAKDAWGVVPDWVLELAELADRSRLRGAATAIGYSVTAVSNVINNKYGAGDIDRIEQVTRGALMGVTVECPMLGPISRKVCLDWQVKPWAPTSSYRMQMYRACHGGCANFRHKGGPDGPATE